MKRSTVNLLSQRGPAEKKFGKRCHKWIKKNIKFGKVLITICIFLYLLIAVTDNSAAHLSGKIINHLMNYIIYRSSVLIRYRS